MASGTPRASLYGAASALPCTQLIALLERAGRRIRHYAAHIIRVAHRQELRTRNSVLSSAGPPLLQRSCFQVGVGLRPALAPFATVKIAVVTPMPSASDRIAAMAKPGHRNRIRVA